jgi:dihydropteroate synthase
MHLKDTLFSVKHTINCAGTVLDLSQAKIMGILNITPDSFYDGGKTMTESSIINHVSQMIADGADIIDVGGYSSRPGAKEISFEEEKERIDRALRIVRHHFPSQLLSIDTFRADIASIAVKEYGVNIINDISAGDLDDQMISTAARLKVPYIMMHMKGTPRMMQINPEYNDVVKEIISYFTKRIAIARSAGIDDIIIDPGFGFGKTIEHNYTLLRELSLLKILGCPLVVGISRKSMIYKPLGLNPENALTGTTVLHGLTLLNGAVMLRVHDVKEAVQTVRMVELYRNSEK